MPAEAWVCAPEECDASAVGRFLAPIVHLPYFNVNDRAQWLVPGIEVAVRRNRSGAWADGGKGPFGR